MKSKINAITSFVLGLLSFIPLLNFVIAPTGVYFGIKSLMEIKKQPELYCGKRYALVGVILSTLMAFTTYSWWILKTMGKI